MSAHAPSPADEPVSPPRVLPEGDSVAIRIVALEKHFRRERGEEVRAIDEVTLDVERGTMVTVLGPSGCGKTTLLRCIAGLEAPTGGEIWNEGRLISSGSRGIIIPPEKRHFGMMFQSYAIWPHMSVFGNVAYALKGRGLARARIEERVQTILRVVGIEHLRNEYPGRMSGGQQQRVALARSLVNEPRVMLFDEPLSNVDAKVREELRVELLAMQREIGFAGVYVTHDQEEAMAISDRIVVMRDGQVLQVGPPQEIYRRPATRFVASFIGVANIWEGTLLPERGPGGEVMVRCGFGMVGVDPANVAPGVTGADAVVIARPESLVVTAAAPSPSHPNVWKGTVQTEMYRGAHTDVFVGVGDAVLRGRIAEHGSGADTALDLGDEGFVAVDPAKLRVLPREPAAAGQSPGGSEEGDG